MRAHKDCLICNREFSAKPSELRRRKYCSRPCFEEAHRTTMAGANNPSYKTGKPKCIECSKQLTHYGHYDGKQPRCNGCARKNNAGEKHYNWQGGKTSENAKIRNSQEYKEWRQAIFRRDGFSCVWCGETGGILHADHINAFAFYPDLRFELSNGRTLCIDCHKKTDSYLSKALIKA